MHVSRLLICTELILQNEAILAQYWTTGYGSMSVHLSQASVLSKQQVTFKVTQGHWYWCHSIGHIQFPISLPL